MDFKSHYATRKSVYRAIQARQHSESQAISDIGRSAVKGNEDLLKYLSDWILGIRSHNSKGYEFEAEWDSLTSVSLSEWFSLQSASETIESELGKARFAEQAANREYSYVATCADLTKIWASLRGETDKVQQIKKLERQLYSTKAQREAVETRKKANIAARQSLGEMFLRDCIANIETLMQSPTFGQRTVQIMEKTANDMNATWESHKIGELQSIDSMISSLEQLRSSYANQEKIEETHGAYSSPKSTEPPANDFSERIQNLDTKVIPIAFP